MEKSVTFSFNSERFVGTEASESFTFKELGIDENLEGEALKRETSLLFLLVWLLKGKTVFEIRSFLLRSSARMRVDSSIT
ncbi:hypothetical protein [Jeotgalibacillus proteolyticus]|uniref:Uncharacterized protein n=1 Tax=Jeotgalibacillus proteolyticus TaxID=2082395 RepID=A0A2S5G946_9BACL|nr:hypothetical protein [Jeotgalibacillus proteolyticus]PPA69516.1 hypothetical protein C4B60_13260 [Jeotgalibacillus proteolyticus]